MASGTLNKPKKGESGAQLLARLSTRTDLSSLDPDVFSDLSSAGTMRKSCGKIIEIYGLGGVGKTELALHYIAKVCLPLQWKNFCLDGKGAKVVVFDTEFKFSVLRLAIVLEKQILSLIEKVKQTHARECEATQTRSDLKLEAVGASCTLSDVDIVEDTSKTDKGTRHVQKGQGDGCSVGDDSDALGVLCHNTHSDGELCLLKDRSGGEVTLTPQDIEDVVADALGRVQVLRIASSDQLLASLISLETSLSNDPLIAMVVVDTISAFYWTDKLADMDNAQVTEARMSPIADTISKYVLECGLSFVVTKSALTSSKRHKDRAQDDSRRNFTHAHTGRGQAALSRSSGREQALNGHAEFLGKSWSSLPLKRLILTKTCDVLGQMERTVWCSEWPSGKSFTFRDDSLLFL